MEIYSSCFEKFPSGNHLVSELFGNLLSWFHIIISRPRIHVNINLYIIYFNCHWKFTFPIQLHRKRLINCYIHVFFLLVSIYANVFSMYSLLNYTNIAATAAATTNINRIYYFTVIHWGKNVSFLILLFTLSDKSSIHGGDIFLSSFHNMAFHCELL